MKNFVFYIFMLCPILYSCSDSDSNVNDESTGNTNRFCLTFVEGYRIPSAIKQTDAYIGAGKTMFNIIIDGDVFTSPSSEFRHYAKLYGDTAYNKYKVEPPLTCLAEPVGRIEIICNRDIDGEHLAGSSLCDLFDLHITSYLRFVQNNYELIDSAVISKPLKDITQEDRTLISSNILLSLNSKIQLSGEYIFGITLGFGNGIELKHDIGIRYPD